MRCLLIIFLVKFVASVEFLSTSFSVNDQCINICKDADIPELKMEKYEEVVCQRGCRFFNIIKFKDELNINTTKRECQISCEESYMLKKESDICVKGCNLMAVKQQMQMSTLLVFTQEEDSNNVVLMEPDIEILETDLLSDPSIKSQLEIGFNIDYKIPETRIRTMPITIQESVEEIQIKDSGDWLDCASRNSGIPRWILLSAILSAVLIALWLSFSTENRNRDEEEPIVDVDVSDHKCIIEEEYVIEKDPSLLETPLVAPNENEACFVAPPKYTIESEGV